jgi:hypothetical protein
MQFNTPELLREAFATETDLDDAEKRHLGFICDDTTKINLFKTLVMNVFKSAVG